MKKILLVILLALTVLPHLFAGHSIAQETATTTARNLPLNTNSDVPQNFHTYSQNVFIEILASAVCFTSGVDILSTDGRCLGVDPITKKIGFITDNSGQGLIAFMGNMIGSTYNLPASTGTYTNYLAGNFGITRTSLAQEEPNCDSLTKEPVKYGMCQNNCSIYLEDPFNLDQCQQGIELRAAQDGNTIPGSSSNTSLGQGVGFDALTPVLNVWKAFRNLTYLLFVVVFVILGIGIMFRLNIDARTVMTIQNQIPKIIVALILITFSYAIAGFLIDVMYLSIYLVVHIFASQKLAIAHNFSNPFTAIGGLGGVGDIANPVAESASSVFRSIFEGTFGGFVSRLVSTVIATLIGGGAGKGVGGIIGAVIGGGVGAFGGPGGAAAGIALGSKLGTIGGALVGTAVGAAKGPSIIETVAGVIIYLVVVIALITALFRTWIALIKAYVYILLDVIFAPIFIVGGLIPGANTGGFTSWIRSLLGNLAAFPTVFILFLTGSAIQSQLKNSDAIGNFSPPLVGGVVGGNGELIASIIGLGIILIMPESVNLTKQFFKSPERKLASAAFAPIGLGAGIVSKPIRNVFGSVWSDDKHGNPGWLKKKIRERGTFVGALLTGGTHTAIDASGRKTIPGARFIVPKRLTSSRIWRGKPRGGPGSAPPPAAGGPTPSTGTPPVTGGGAAAAPAAGATATPVVTHPAASSVPPATSGGPVSVGPSPKDITDETTRRVEAKFGSWASAPSDQINKIREEVTKDLTKDDTSEA